MGKSGTAWMVEVFIVAGIIGFFSTDFNLSFLGILFIQLSVAYLLLPSTCGRLILLVSLLSPIAFATIHIISIVIAFNQGVLWAIAAACLPVISWIYLALESNNSPANAYTIAVIIVIFSVIYKYVAMMNISLLRADISINSTSEKT